MCPDHPRPESSGNPDLPTFSDRLPDLMHLLRQTGDDLASVPANQSYIPYWEDLYASAHSLKGVLTILSCPEPVARFIRDFNEALVAALSGTKVCRRLKEASQLFQEASAALDVEDIQKIDGKHLDKWLEKFRSLHENDIPHEERIKEVPPHLFYVNEFVTKKAREIRLLNMNHCVVEDLIFLDEIPLWRTQLNEALLSKEFGRGIVVNFLPFLSPEGSRQLKVWAWVAASTYSRAALKQRIKEVIPKVTITRL